MAVFGVSVSEFHTGLFLFKANGPKTRQLGLTTQGTKHQPAIGGKAKKKVPCLALRKQDQGSMFKCPRFFFGNS